MRIALDYDLTFDVDRTFWTRFIRMATEHGHDVTVVTKREPTLAVDVPCKVVYTSRRAKLAFVTALGLRFDVWIDDTPASLFTDG